MKYIINDRLMNIQLMTTLRNYLVHKGIYVIIYFNETWEIYSVLYLSKLRIMSLHLINDYILRVYKSINVIKFIIILIFLEKNNEENKLRIIYIILYQNTYKLLQ